MIVTRRALCAPMLLLLMGSSASAADLFVPGQFPTIQAAINAAQDRDSVLIAPGTYSEELIIQAGKRVALKADGPAGSVIFDAAPLPPGTTLLSIFLVGNAFEGDVFTIERITFRNSNGAPAVEVFQGGADFIDCRFENNSSSEGGAFFSSGDVSFSDFLRCEFVGNSATNDGAAVYILDSPSTDFIDCLFESNVAADSGAAATFENIGEVLFENTVFRSNVANGLGAGAVDFLGGELDIINCLFETNSAVDGVGALLIEDLDTPATANVFQSVFRGNTSSLGGAIGAVGDATIDILSSTFQSNSGADADDVLAVNGALAATVNSVLNSPVPLGTSTSALPGLVGTIQVVTSHLPAPSADPRVFASDLLTGNPLLDPATSAPLAGSPLIDRASQPFFPNDFDDLDNDGDLAEIYPFDFFGNTRGVDDPASPNDGLGSPSTIDIGAIEFGSSGPDPTLPGDTNGDGAVTALDISTVLSNFGATGVSGPSEGDLNGDGAVTALDISIVLSAFGTTLP